MKIKALFEGRNLWFVMAGATAIIMVAMCTMIMLFTTSPVAQTQGW